MPIKVKRKKKHNQLFIRWEAPSSFRDDVLTLCKKHKCKLHDFYISFDEEFLVVTEQKKMELSKQWEDTSISVETLPPKGRQTIRL